MTGAADLVLAARGLAAAPAGAPAVLAGVDLEVRRGEWIAITGSNGSGKTTLALALAGLLPVREGALALEGEPLEAGSANRARVAVVLQEPALQITQATVRDEIAFAAVNLGAGEREARETGERIARELGLAAELGRTPRTLSAGGQQMVLLAAALAVRPALLVADEACAHVDHEGRERALAAVRAAAGGGMAVVWVTQDPGEAGRADRVFEVTAGRLREVPRGHSTVAPSSGDSLAEPSWSQGNAEAGSAPPALGRVLVASRHGHPAVELRIPPAGIVALVGPNGAGKTTVLESLAGVSAREGIQVGWDSALASPPLLVGELPEHQIFAERVADEIAHAAVARGRSRQTVLMEATELLGALGLGPEFLDRRTWSLSSGEKRLVLTVAALVAPAAVVLLDEPTCGLDSSRREALANIVHHGATKRPFIVATQDLAWLGLLAVRSRERLRTYRLQGFGMIRNTPRPGKETD